MADLQFGPGRLYIQGASGWVDIGATEGGIQFQLNPVAEASCSVFPLSLPGLTLTAHGTDPDGRLYHFVTSHMPARWHRRHCRWCNPAAFAPRCPYGREYHRRQQARKRRRRR